MRIECPSCKLSGNIDDATVPATGLAMTCPRCKARFVVERPAVAAEVAAAMVDSCPACQYATFSEEKFASCPKCGLNIADYFQQQRSTRETVKPGSRRPAATRPTPDLQPPPVPLTAEQRRKDEEARKRYGLGAAAAAGEAAEPVRSRFAGNLPLPVMGVGWGAIVFAGILAVYGISGFMGFSAKLEAAKLAVEAGDEAQSGGVLFLQFGLFPLLGSCYALGLAFIGSQFLLLKQWTLKALVTAAKVGMVLVAATELVDAIVWCRRASDDASLGYYASGVFGGLLAAALWIVPLLVLMEYLGSDHFDTVSDIFN